MSECVIWVRYFRNLQTRKPDQARAIVALARGHRAELDRMTKWVLREYIREDGLFKQHMQDLVLSSYREVGDGGVFVCPIDPTKHPAEAERFEETVGIHPDDRGRGL